MKKSRWLQGLLMIGLGVTVISGCSKEEKQTWNPNAVKEFSGTALTDSEDGVYFMNDIGEETANGSTMQIVKYFDTKEKSSVPLCDKANCKHDSMDCPAVQLGEYEGRKLVMLTPYKDALYLSYMSDNNEASRDVIMKADADGKNRHTIYTFPKGALMNQGILYQDTLFLSCNMTGAISAQDEGVSGTKLFVYDLKKEKAKTIASTKKDEDGFLYYLGCQDGKAYYVHDVYKNKKKPVYAYDIKTKKTTCVDADNTIASSMLYKNKLYGADEKKNELFSYDITTKKKQILVNFTPYKEKGQFQMLSRQGLLRLSYVIHPGTRQSKAYYQIYDVEKEKFLYPNYQESSDIYERYQDGYLGSKKNTTGYFDKQMNFHPFT